VTDGTVTQSRFKSVVFDVDSTVSELEGIDWLAMQRGPDVARECAALTAQAMNGALPLEAIYERRLAAIKPTREDIEALAHAYRFSLQPDARLVITALRRAKVEVHLLSGGLRDALVPLAETLGIRPSRVHAVILEPDELGHFVRLHGAQPLATQRGKPLVLSQLLSASALKRPVVMIGDGSTDAATRGVVDHFIAYTGVARRESVVSVADAEASDFLSLLPLLLHLPPSPSHG
jgi:phosphoserine phosphatase